jgi:dTDP-glucose 4,6-dehydratase
MPDSAHCPHENLITFVTDRPGHDFRYAIDDENTRRELDWAPRKSFEQGLGETVDWFLNNEWWWRKLMDERYDGRRLGLSMSEEKKA